MKSGRESIRERIITEGLLFDGAMGTLLEKRRKSLPHFECPEKLVLEAPEEIYKIYREYLDAGADVIESCTFGATPHKLSLYGLEDFTYEINKRATVLAKKAASDFPRALVAGSIGPTGLLSIEKRVDFGTFYNNFYTQAKAVIEGGVDIVLIETCNDLLETRAAVIACRDAMNELGVEILIIVSFSIDRKGRMLLGTPVDVAAVNLDHMDVDVIGINCSMGPDGLKTHLKLLQETVSTPLLAMPNRGLPINVDGKAVYEMDVDEFVRQMVEFRKMGIHVIGGCCGTTPGIIKRLRDALRSTDCKLKASPRGKRPVLTGVFEAVDIAVEKKPIIVGERLNVFGSKKFKRAVENLDLDEVITIARSQIEKGARVLDMCVSVRDVQKQLELIRLMVPPVAVNVSFPIMIDTTEEIAIEEACRRFHGRGVINSCNFEDIEKCRTILRLARKYSHMVVCLPLASSGIPRDARARLDVAERLYDVAMEEGMKPNDLIFDPLTLTLGTGRREDRKNGLVTLETLELFKNTLQGSYTILGVSNISFGLPKKFRPVLNNVLLYHAAKKGLDFALFNPLELKSKNEIEYKLWELAEDLLLNRKPDALDRIMAIDKLGKKKEEKGNKKGVEIDQVSHSYLKKMIVQRRREGFVQLLELLLKKYSPKWLIDEVFIPAMKEVGMLMDKEGLPLPYVLESASMAQEGLNLIKKYFPIEDTANKGTIVLATVKGDVHDIGKNLVKMLLVHNGFRVVDLGTDAPADSIVEAAREKEADIVGLSALLVSTSLEMKNVISQLESNNLRLPVIIGGAAVNEDYACELCVQNDHLYEGAVFYAKDAFHALKLVEGLMNPGRRSELKESAKTRCLEMKGMSIGKKPSQKGKTLAASIQVPSSPKGVEIFEVDILSVLNNFDFEKQCRRKFLRKNGKDMEPEFYKSLLSLGQLLLAELEHDRLLFLKGVRSSFSVLLDGKIVKLDVEGQKIPLSLDYRAFERIFTFNGRKIFPVFVVTIGDKLNKKVKEFFNQGDYLKGYVLSMIGAELTEETAEQTSMKILSEMKIERKSVVRYSPGYPVWPDLRDQRIIFDLLNVENNIGVHLSEANQMVPEFSISAGLLYRAHRIIRE